MRRLIAATLMSSVLAAPALAVNGISLDGSSLATAYQDPYGVPLGDGIRYGAVNFRFSSMGQVNDGWVHFFGTMYPDDQYDGPFKIRFFTSTYSDSDIGPGQDCPYLAWDQDNQMGDNSDGSLSALQLQRWSDQHCDIRPDPHLFSSGAKMGIELRLSSRDGGWQVAQWELVAPMDGRQYDATMFWGTGVAGVGSPFAKLVVSQRGGYTGTLADPDYLDTSYNYTGDGFDVPFRNLFSQFGCDTPDTSYVDACWTGLTAEFWLQPDNDEGLIELSPFSTFMGFFLSSSGDNSAPYIGAYGQLIYPTPPMSYHTGDDTTFLTNAADLGWGVTEPQTYLSQAWSQDGTSNPNFNGLGAGVQAAGQDF